MIKLELINADIIDDTDTVTSRLFRKSFNCRYNPRMDYAFCLLTLKSSEKWWSPLFGAICNFNDQILPYCILFLTFINTDNNNNNFIDLKSKHWTIIKRQNRTKLNTYNPSTNFKEDSTEECMSYLSLKITIFIRIISHCTQQCHSLYIKIFK
jgi:hypothetical protein